MNYNIHQLQIEKRNYNVQRIFVPRHIELLKIIRIVKININKTI